MEAVLVGILFVAAFSGITVLSTGLQVVLFQYSLLFITCVDQFSRGHGHYTENLWDYNVGQFRDIVARGIRQAGHEVLLVTATVGVVAAFGLLAHLVALGEVPEACLVERFRSCLQHVVGGT